MKRDVLFQLPDKFCGNSLLINQKNVYKVSMYNLGEYHVLCRWAWSLQERGDLLLREQTVVLDTVTLLAFLFECGWGIYNKPALSSFELFLPKSSLTSKFL